jgi:1-acyl-sn-glycerol-3-phosphate acyltransferase
MIGYLRSLLFYAGYSLSLVPHSIVCVLLAPVLSLRGRYRLCLVWNRFALWWLSVTCGVRYKVIGAENVPKEPVVLLSNHQSAWETVFMVLYFVPICPILKFELLKIPFFGWGLKLLKPIAIDRSKRREARQALLTQGCERLAEGLSVLVFPEGTSRVTPGEARKFASGGAELAIAAKAKVLPVAHDAGLFWPSHQFLKRPGTITVRIGAPIDATDRDPRELTEEVRVWVEESLREMQPELYPPKTKDSDVEVGDR